MIKQWLQYSSWRLLNPIIPCAICALPGSLLICQHCIAELETNPIDFNQIHDITERNLTNNQPVFSYIYCKYRYATPLNKMLHQLKYKGNLNNTWALGRLLATVLYTVKTDTDFILPMPLSKERLHERGFNQVHELLKYYQIMPKHIPIKTNIVTKIIDTPHQTQLSLRDRQIEQNVYQVNQKITGKKILIVDDVITTGNTANNLAKCLINAGAARVELCALMRTA